MANMEQSFKSILQPTDDNIDGKIEVIRSQFESSSLLNISANLVLFIRTGADRKCSLKGHAAGDQ
jgi:hypothetical protein